MQEREITTLELLQAIGELYIQNRVLRDAITSRQPEREIVSDGHRESNHSTPTTAGSDSASIGVPY
jgi:hypothetical protein